MKVDVSKKDSIFAFLKVVAHSISFYVKHIKYDVLFFSMKSFKSFLKLNFHFYNLRTPRKASLSRSLKCCKFNYSLNRFRIVCRVFGS